MKYYFSSFLLLFLTINISAQQKKQSDIYSIAFYNVENLFDTKKDKNVDDAEFTPQSEKKWTMDKYQKKLTNLAYVISELGRQTTPNGPAIVGVAEVENRGVLEDLVAQKSIAADNYQIVHHDSPDARGIDVALLYNPKQFKLKSYKVYPYRYPAEPALRTRDQLLVSGELAGEPFHVIVNHWPSRRGETANERRDFAASISKKISDSLYKDNPKAKIVIMGDMNDDPKDYSCRVVLNAKKDEKDVKKGGLFNTMWKIHDSGIGSLCYRDKWNLFDQIIISESLIDKKSPLRFKRAEVFNREFLIQTSGRYKGYPLRTFSGNNFLNGYSDHFPTLIYLEYNK